MGLCKRPKQIGHYLGHINTITRNAAIYEKFWHPKMLSRQIICNKIGTDIYSS